MRRSDRTSGPPRRPLDDEFEGTAPPEGRGRRARDDDRGGNDEGRRSRRVVERTRVRFSQEDLDAELRERRAAAKNKEEKAEVLEEMVRLVVNRVKLTQITTLHDY